MSLFNLVLKFVLQLYKFLLYFNPFWAIEQHEHLRELEQRNRQNRWRLREFYISIVETEAVVPQHHTPAFVLEQVREYFFDIFHEELPIGPIDAQNLLARFPEAEQLLDFPLEPERTGILEPTLLYPE